MVVPITTDMGKRPAIAIQRDWPDLRRSAEAQGREILFAPGPRGLRLLRSVHLGESYRHGLWYSVAYAAGAESIAIADPDD